MKSFHDPSLENQTMQFKKWQKKWGFSQDKWQVYKNMFNIITYKGNEI